MRRWSMTLRRGRRATCASLYSLPYNASIPPNCLLTKHDKEIKNNYNEDNYSGS